MELDKRNIEEYINRFLEGETTNAEEQAIYRFFHTGDVPSHLMGYAPMFAWYEGRYAGRTGYVRAQTVRRRLQREEIGKDTGGWKRRLLSAYSGSCMDFRYSGNDGHCAGVRLDFLLGEPSRRKW